TWKIIISHRGTDTNDDFIADLAVGSGAEFVKFGAPARGERVAKYNRLLEIVGK
ncbi:phosphopyruvate hydratase, partial [candidate division WWE3 bacterium CG_4_9_14_3_um_filter_34_6]